MKRIVLTLMFCMLIVLGAMLLGLWSLTALPM